MRAWLDDSRARISCPDPNDRRAVEGSGATLAALRAGLADSVPPAFDPAAVPTAWIGPGLAVNRGRPG